ncbi:hypothetical protein Sta7437_0997 [Stanieria cyanosphaera PCC 7437]|uniref:Methyltransferase type 11 n=1 Tax=Stanieria cyanosphaera (strain ATCC 29371 / PCC 7437) TaxID=111780 RepID=K9XSF1_STAC7|nr:methyltransferase domain-containing protein [Stanieria cyanosphaera]AFZ34577.1 hypothetical protein Sta7437_0997 [Stanieria cyanosphaera PCC 7437]
MNVIEYPLSLKLYKYSCSLLSKIQAALNVIFAGFWLGILNRKTLQLADRIFYDNDSMYQDEAYNRSGFWDWEVQAIQDYFESSKKILVAGAGGGREIYALHKSGYQADGFECNPNLVEFANNFLSKEGINSQVKIAPRDTCPTFNQVYDGLIVGWGAYTNIQGKQHRIEFLKQMRSQVKNQAPLLLSFFPRKGNNLSYKLIALIGNLIRSLPWAEKIELGDSLLPHRIFVHYFTKEEIEYELNEAGFKLIFFANDNYGYAIGVVIENN